MITAGKEWQQAIDYQLESADCVLLLVSPDFMESDYCYSIEMERALERHREGSALVIPVIVRPVLWRNTLLGALQALPKDGKPVTDWARLDRAWLNVIEGLRLVLAGSPS
jgi:TIR domain-containing protein